MKIQIEITDDMAAAMDALNHATYPASFETTEEYAVSYALTFFNEAVKGNREKTKGEIQASVSQKIAELPLEKLAALKAAVDAISIPQ